MKTILARSWQWKSMDLHVPLDWEGNVHSETCTIGPNISNMYLIDLRPGNPVNQIQTFC